MACPLVRPVGLNSLLLLELDPMLLELDPMLLEPDEASGDDELPDPRDELLPEPELPDELPELPEPDWASAGAANSAQAAQATDNLRNAFFIIDLTGCCFVSKDRHHQAPFAKRSNL
jgi:hypothetical protein